MHQAPSRTRSLAPPRAVVCVGCNGQYFAASLPIHQKVCFERNAFIPIQCPTCRVSTRTGLFLAHMKSCAGEPPGNQNEGSVSAATDLLHTRNKDHTTELNLPDEDGRVRCKICERAFQADRVAKHQAVCAGKPRSASQTSRTRSRELSAPSSSSASKPRSQMTLTAKPKRSSGPSQRSSTATCPPRLAVFPDPSVAFKGGSGWGRDADSKRFDIVTRDARRGDTRSRYPGSGQMQARDWESMLNSSSAGNPLVTNQLMTSGGL